MDDKKLEELKKQKEENSRPAKERSARKAAKLEYDEVRKLSHDWHRTIVKTSYNSFQPMLSNCKRCGVNYYLFKGKPEFCPNPKK